MAAAVVAAAPDRRVPKAPPGTKTARHRRTNGPQNRTGKVPNVTSEPLTRIEDLRELMRATRRLLPLLLPAPKQQSTNIPQNGTEKVFNVTSETLLELKT